MRLTIIPSDGTVVKDGVGYSDLVFSVTDASIHAVQWYDTDGTVEIIDARGRIIDVRIITDLTPFQSALDAWQHRHDNPPIPQPMIPSPISGANYEN
jgi:hypothetical protein